MRTRPLLLLLSLAACDGKDRPHDDSVAPVDTADDTDGDGYDLVEDCDDTNAEVNPGADEECDGIDNNCDTQIDEGVTTTEYEDRDGDGFGDSSTAVEVCEGPWLPVGGDCDDTDPYIYPDAEEICDGADNDCDGATDEEGTLALYADEDADGYGDPGSPTTGCAATDGLSEDSTDCDDADPGINPGEAEICGDGVDQDCDEADRVCTRTLGDVPESSATAELMGATGEYAGSRVRPAGDMNGDGVDDLLVDLYGWGPSSADFSGAVMLVHGPVSGVVAIADVADATLYGSAESEYAGWAMSRGEDLDGDGWPDVAIGAYGRYDAGRGVSGGGYVVYGPLSGTESLASADGLILPDNATLSNLGYEISSSPDLTGDGVGDVILGSYGDSADGFKGAAWVVPGPVDGAVTLSDGVTVSGEDPVDLAGNGLDGVGDVNGDGAADLVVGAHGDDTAGDAAGKAGVFYGPLTGDLSLADADRSLLGANADDEFSRNGVGGRGDVDGDGLDDLLVGAMFSSPSGTYSGSAALFAGDATATGAISASAATAIITGEAVYDFVGRSADIAGDVDGDGVDDLIVSGHGADGGVADAGRVGLYYGPVSGSHTLGAADARYLGATTNEGFGINGAGAGDTDGDGRGDLLIGAWFNADNGSYAGAAFLYTGG